MKKSVVILIGIIYIMAIAAVSFFGLKIKGFDTTTYVDNIEFTGEDIRVQSNGDKYIFVKFDETHTYQLEWEVTPDEATYKDVNFGYDETSTVGSVDENGLVTFNRKGTLTVYIRSVDGSGSSDHVTLRAY